MKIICPSCGADFQMNPGQGTSGGLQIKCPACLHVFLAFDDGSTAAIDGADGTSGVGVESVMPPPPPSVDAVPAPPPSGNVPSTASRTAPATHRSRWGSALFATTSFGTTTATLGRPVFRGQSAASDAVSCVGRFFR